MIAWGAFPLQKKRNLPEEREAHPRGDPKSTSKKCGPQRATSWGGGE